jgi:hypothetical protein
LERRARCKNGDEDRVRHIVQELSGVTRLRAPRESPVPAFNTFSQ